MSGVYIKGMEMPKKYPVTVTIFPDGISVAKTISGRRFTATAAPVPTHGRLFDADVVCKECREVAEEYDGIYPDCSYCPVHMSPTIIPADKEEKET